MKETTILKSCSFFYFETNAFWQSNHAKFIET